MSVKRVSGLHAKGARNCLKCDRELEDLKDDVINTCKHCGQQHLVDIVGSSITLTVAEKPDLRHRAIKVAAVQQAEELKEEKKELLRDLSREIELQTQVDELKAELKREKAKSKKAIKQSEKEQQAAAAQVVANYRIIEEKDREIERLSAELENKKRLLMEQMKGKLKAEKDAREWEQAADGLAHKLEELKAQGAW